MKKKMALLCALFLFLLCSCKSRDPDISGKKMGCYFNTEPKTLDPQIVADEAGLTAVTALFEGLTRLDENGQAVPGVAERWEENADHTSFTFYLREDAVWSDITSDEPAEPVVAADFVFAFQRAVDPATNSPNARQLFCIVNAQAIFSGTMDKSALGVTAVNDRTLSVHLAYSCPDFPQRVAEAVFMPCNQTFFEGTSGRYGLERSYVLGNGPFEFAGRYSWVHGQSMELSKSSVYWDRKETLPSGLRFYFGSALDPTSPATALSTVQVLPVENEVAKKLSEQGYETQRYLKSTYGLLFNVSDSLMQHLEIRSAFVQSLGREALLSALPEGTQEASDLISGEVSLFGRNYRELAGSGFYKKEDSSAVQAALSLLPSLELSAMPGVTVLCPDTDTAKRAANAMISAWNQKLGAYFNMEPLPESELQSRIQSGEYQLAIYGIEQKGNTPMGILGQFSNGAQNPAKWNDSAFETLLSSVYTSSDMLSEIVSAEKYLNDNCIFYPVWYGSGSYVFGKGATGIILRPLDSVMDFKFAGIVE